MLTPPKLLRIIRCPNCMGKLLPVVKSYELQCDCGKRYPILDGVPILLQGDLGNAYDDLYRQIDFKVSPFGYDRKYIMWRKAKINLEIVKYLKDGSVLDDGGGYGFLKQFLDEGENEYYNLDYSYEMVRYDNSALRCVGSGENLPFADESFDNVVSGDVLEHVQDKEQYLRETYRVLKSFGVFVLNTPRTGWVDSWKKSIWFWIPYLSSVIKWGKKWLRNENMPQGKCAVPAIRVPEGVVDRPSDEETLLKQLKGIGYQVLVQSRTDNHVFGFTGTLWNKFADIFINPKQFGHCVFFVCKKS